MRVSFRIRKASPIAVEFLHSCSNQLVGVGSILLRVSWGRYRRTSRPV